MVKKLFEKNRNNFENGRKSGLLRRLRDSAPARRPPQ
jgi:hypothetical protein